MFRQDLYVLLLALVGVLLGKQSFGQLTVSDSDIYDRLIELEERFQEVRSEYCVLITGEQTLDDKRYPAPNTVRVDYILANCEKKKASRQDIGLGGDVFDLTPPEDWYWNRNLRVGTKRTRLQGNSGGGIDDKDERPFLKAFDPLTVTVCSFGDLVSGKANPTWFAERMLDGEVIEGEYTKKGDLLISVVTSKKRAAWCQVLLSKSHGFLPVESRFFLNGAKDKSHDVVAGTLISRSKTSWKKHGDGFLPATLQIEYVDKAKGKKRTYDYRFLWYTDKFDHDLLFNEARMRERWDSTTSLWETMKDAKQSEKKK